MRKRIDKPKVFISYAWAGKDYEDRVYELASNLVNDGIDVVFDKWDLQEGNDTYAFMEKSVHDDTITNVLILLDPSYEEKANSRHGGVGTETQIISAEVYNRADQNKILPVVFKRKDDGSVPKPIYLRNTLHFDLSIEDKYYEEYTRMVRTLYGIDTYQKPELGCQPAWLNNTPSVVTKTQKALRKLKTSESALVRGTDFQILLNNLSEEILSFGKNRSTNENVSQGNYLSMAEDIIPIRDEFLQAFSAIPYVVNGYKTISECLEEIAYKMDNEAESVFRSVQRTCLHELFIYLIAIYYRNKNYEALAYTFNKTFFGTTYQKQIDGVSFHVFYNVDDTLHKAMIERDNKKHLSGETVFWMEHLNIDYCSKQDFVFADCLCFNAAVFSKEYAEDNWYWFPKTYPYSGNAKAEMRRFAVKMKSKEHLSRVSKVFGYTSIDQFISKFKEVENSYREGKYRLYRHNSCFSGAPILCDFITSDELGISN